MILSSQSIKRYINQGRIKVDPEPEVEQFQPASLDVRLGDKLYDCALDRTFEDSGDGLALRPGRTYLGHTKDIVSLPNDVAAMLTGRSSVGRSGVIIHKTAGFIDPGFSGDLTLEMYNFGLDRVFFKPGDRVGQLVFFRLDEPTIEPYDGQYQGQRGPQK